MTLTELGEKLQNRISKINNVREVLKEYDIPKKLTPKMQEQFIQISSRYFELVYKHLDEVLDRLSILFGKQSSTHNLNHLAMMIQLTQNKMLESDKTLLQNIFKDSETLMGKFKEFLKEIAEYIPDYRAFSQKSDLLDLPVRTYTDEKIVTELPSDFEIQLLGEVYDDDDYYY